VVEVVTSANADRAGVGAGRDQTGDMGHVDHQKGADLSAMARKALPVDQPRIGRKAGDDHLRPMGSRQRLDLIVVDRPLAGSSP
jgi:hypothetical protein